MKISINALTVRPLTPNEQKVYKLMCEGLEPIEIAKQLHMGLRGSCLSNIHDVPNDIVMNLIASIREKGHEISENKNEEDENMGKQIYSDEVKSEVLQLSEKGLTPKEISDKFNLPYKSVWEWINEFKKNQKSANAEKRTEPAPAATCTSS